MPRPMAGHNFTHVDVARIVIAVTC